MGIGCPATSTSVAPSAPLEVRVLGELQLVRRGERPIPLPASKKTRALIGYLVVTGQPHRREHLCDLLWEGPHDPRAELRWSLNKIRSLVNGAGSTRLTADRERVSFEPQEAVIDLARLRQLLARGVSASSIDELKGAVGLFRGELLDGLELPSCYRFQEWCLAERETARRMRLSALGELVERLVDTPDAALLYARSILAIDPLSEHGHAAVVRLLATMGQRREALSHYEHARRLIEAELGVHCSTALEGARNGLRVPRTEGASLPTPLSAASNKVVAVVQPPPETASATQTTETANSLSVLGAWDRPSIAVLPFVNLSGDPKQEYFSDGVTEDIITELSRYGDLTVIARSSAFTFRGEQRGVMEISRDLSVSVVRCFATV